jgi:ATP-binding protein involved in chromosome partitioning
MSNNQATQPLTIKANRDAGRLALEWADGHRTEYDMETLRLLCPCASCQGEGGHAGWLDTKPTLTAVQTQLVDLHMIGLYAIAPVWGDGHDTGYYTFTALRASCPCPICTAERLGPA